MSIRVVIADDHALVREGLRSLLGTVPDIELVATAATAHEAVREATTKVPDVLVLDINLPDASGIDVARKLRRVATSRSI